MTKKTLRCLWLADLIAVVFTAGMVAPAAPIIWIGGNTNWDATITKWNPNDEPDSDDEAIFNMANTVNLANASESIMALTMSGGIELLLNGNDLTVNGGSVTLSGAGTLLDVPTNSTLNTDDVFVNADASLTMHGGTITMAQSGGDAVLTVASGGALGGHGTINSTDVIAAANTVVLSIGGNLVVTSLDLFSQQAATLAVNVPTNGRVDLDQTNAVIDITRNDTLDINGAAHDPAVDAYSGTLNLAEGATLDMSNSWGMNAGSINVNTNGINVNTAGAAATIAGGELTQTGGSVNLADSLDSLQFTAPYTALGGTIINNGLVIFDAEGIVGPSADFQMIGSAASITVTDGNVLSVTNGDFDLGGSGDDVGNVTTIGDGSSLFVHMDFDSGTGDVIDHRIELNGGQLDVSNSDAGFAGTDTIWHLSGGVLNANSGFCLVSGDDLIIGSETINVAAGATFRTGFLGGTMAVEIQNATFNVSGSVDLNSTTRWTNSNVSVTGTGILRPGASTIDAEVVWDVATVDVDDGPITVNGFLTINADSIDYSGDGVDGSITINEDAALLVSIAGGGNWTLDPAGTINYNGDAAVSTFLAGSNINLNGTLNVTGDGRTDAALNIGSTGVVNILTAGEAFTLSGGNNTDSANRIAGGVINGPGILRADDGLALIGFGTINANVDFNFVGFSNLQADDGTLNVHSIVDVNILGTADTDGVLNVIPPWNTDVAIAVELNGGTLQGGVITNDGGNGIRGHGFVVSQVINNTQIDALDNGLLILQTPGNNNDWDGVGNTGELSAAAGNLEIRDNATFPFGGVVSGGLNRIVFVNGFELEFEQASTLELFGAIYRSTHATHLGGTITIGAAGGPSRLQIAGTAIFENGSNTTLTGDLQLENGGTRVDAGSTFSGSGAFINMPGSFLTLTNGADVDVLVENRGTLLLGSSAGQTTGLSFEQTAIGEWNVDLGGTSSGEFDRMSLTGTADLDGRLNLLLIGSYVPAVGDRLNILSAAGGVSGSFSSVPRPIGMPPELEFDVVYSATQVQLVVVSDLPGDYNLDGLVNTADFVTWRDHFGSDTALPNDDTSGVAADDYDRWIANFGNTALNGNSSLNPAAVPEPARGWLLLMALVGVWRGRACPWR